MENYPWQANDPGPPLGSQSYDSYVQYDGAMEKIYNYRPPIPQSAEEVSDQILDKLEQAGRVPSKEKFRRMACNTFVYTGACPYNDRCVFLHDYRIKAEGVKVRTTRQTKSSSNIKDTFYWPDMTRKDVIRNTDAQGLPTANQIYVIPEPFKGNPSNFHNRGLYSLWSHFVEFCVHNSIFYTKKFRDISSEGFFQMSSYKENPHVSGAKRLEVFIRLSLGYTIRKADGSTEKSSTTLLLRGVTHTPESGLEPQEQAMKLRLQREPPFMGDDSLLRKSPQLIPPGQGPSTPSIIGISPKHFLPSDWGESNEEKVLSTMSDDNRTIAMFPKVISGAGKPVARRSFMDIPSVGSFTKLPNEISSNSIDFDSSFSRNKQEPNTLQSMTEDLYDSFAVKHRRDTAISKQIAFEIPSNDFLSSMDVGVSGTLSHGTLPSKEGLSPSLSFSYDSMFHPHDHFHEPDSILDQQYSYDWQKSFDELDEETDENEDEAYFDQAISQSLESTAETIRASTIGYIPSKFEDNSFESNYDEKEKSGDKGPSSSASTMLPWTLSKRDEFPFSFDSGDDEHGKLELEKSISSQDDVDEEMSSLGDNEHEYVSSFLQGYKEKESKFTIDDLWAPSNSIENGDEGNFDEGLPRQDVEGKKEIKINDSLKCDSGGKSVDFFSLGSLETLHDKDDSEVIEKEESSEIKFGSFSPWSTPTGTSGSSLLPPTFTNSWKPPSSSSQSIVPAALNISPSLSTALPANMIASSLPTRSPSFGAVENITKPSNLLPLQPNYFVGNEGNKFPKSERPIIPLTKSFVNPSPPTNLYNIQPPEESEESSMSEFVSRKESNRFFQTSNHESTEEWDTLREAYGGQTIKLPQTTSFGRTSIPHAKGNIAGVTVPAMMPSTGGAGGLLSTKPSASSPKITFGGLNIVGPTDGNSPISTSIPSLQSSSGVGKYSMNISQTPSSNFFSGSAAAATSTSVPQNRNFSSRPPQNNAGYSLNTVTTPMSSSTAATNSTNKFVPQFPNYQQPQQQLLQQHQVNSPSFKIPPFDSSSPSSFGVYSSHMNNSGIGGAGMNTSSLYQASPLTGGSAATSMMNPTFDRRRSFSATPSQQQQQQQPQTNSTLPPRPSYPSPPLSSGGSNFNMGSMDNLQLQSAGGVQYPAQYNYPNPQHQHQQQYHQKYGMNVSPATSYHQQSHGRMQQQQLPPALQQQTYQQPLNPNANQYTFAGTKGGAAQMMGNTNHTLNTVNMPFGGGMMGHGGAVGGGGGGGNMMENSGGSGGGSGYYNIQPPLPTPAPSTSSSYYHYPPTATTTSSYTPRY